MCEVERGSKTTYKRSHMDTDDLRLHDKLRKVETNTITTSRVSRFHDKFQQHDISTTQIQDKGHTERLQNGAQVTNHTCKKISSDHWQALSHYWHNFSSTTYDKSITERQKSCNKDQWMEHPPDTLSRKHKTTTVVDTKSSKMERNQHHTRHSNHSDLHRRIKGGLGSSTGNLATLWLLGRPTKMSTHQHSRTHSNTLCAPSIQRLERPISVNQNRQFNVCSIFESPRRDDLPELKQTSRKDLEHMPNQELEDNSTTYSQEIEHISRLSIKNDDQHPTSRLFLQISRPILPSSRCVSPGLDTNKRLDESSLDSNTQDSIQSDKGQNNHCDSDTILDDCIMVPDTFGSFDRSPDSITGQTSFHSGENEQPQSNEKSKIEDIRMSYLRQRLTKKGFSQEAVELVESTTERSSNNTIGSALRKWTLWCEESDIDPIQCSVNHVVDFLTEMSNRGMATSPFCGYDYVSNIQKESTFTPPEDTIDIIPCLEHITAMGNNNKMLIIKLIKKTAFLLTITSAARPSDLQRISLKSMTKINNGYSCNIDKPKEHKISITHREKKLRQKTLIIEHYDDEPLLCPVAALKNIITVADPTARAKDLKVISAYLAQESGANTDAILAFGNWSSCETKQGINNTPQNTRDIVYRSMRSSFRPMV
ncbi:13777_t:CDS:2, partial [Dentiscutata heterogama]